MNFLRRFLLDFSSCLDATSFHSLSVRWRLIIRCLIAQVMRPEVQCELRLRLTIMTTGRVCGLFLQAVSTDLHTASAHRLWASSALGATSHPRFGFTLWQLRDGSGVGRVAASRKRKSLEAMPEPRAPMMSAGIASAQGGHRYARQFNHRCDLLTFIIVATIAIIAIDTVRGDPYGLVRFRPDWSGLARVGSDSMVVMRNCAARLQPHACEMYLLN